MTFRSSQITPLLECEKEAPSDAVVATDPASADADGDNGATVRGTRRTDGADGRSLVTRVKAVYENVPSRVSCYRLLVGSRKLGQRFVWRSER